MVSRSEMLKRITVPRRIMLLLYDNRKYSDSYDVPEVVSQMGIANELNLRQNHVSRSLSELASEKLIFSRTSRIQGAVRKKKVYFLTQEGISEITDFIENISNKKVLVHTPEDELREYSLDRIAREIKHRQGYLPSYHELLTKLSNGIEIDLNQVLESDASTPGKVKKLNIPMERHFYGRISERKKILNAISGDQNRFVVINSIAGQGKTALLIKIVSEIENRPVFWTSLNEWSRLSNLLNEWSYFFKEHKSMKLFNYLGTADKFNLQNAIEAFIKDSRLLKPVFVIDDFHKAEEDIVGMFKLLNNLLATENNINILISSRIKPGFYTRKDMLISKTVLELELTGLDRESSMMILKEKGIPESDFESAFELTKGHPLALELFSTALFSEEQHAGIEFDAFLGEEVIKNLNPEELDVVKLASILQNPVYRSAFFFKSEIDSDLIDQLCKKLILRAYQNGTYDTHDLIKSYFLNRLSDFEKKEYLSIALSYYSTRGSEKDTLEYLRLLNESDDRKLFISALLENGDFLLSQGYTQVGEYLQEIDDNEVSKIDSVRLLILKSDLAFVNNNLPLARNYLNKGLKHSEILLEEKDSAQKNEDVIPLLSRIYYRSAEISKLEGRLDETIKAYRESVKINRQYGNKAEVGKALNNLALAYRERGQLDLALKQLLSAKEIFQDIPDLNALALVDVNIGDIYFLRQDFGSADTYFKSAEKTILKYPQIKGLIHGKIGRTRLLMGRPKAAESSLLKSLDAYTKSNDLYNQLKDLNDLYRCASTQTNKEDSKRYLADSRRLLGEHYQNHSSSDQWFDLFNDHLINKINYAVTRTRSGTEEAINNYIEFHSANIKPKLILEDLDRVTSELSGNKSAILMLYKALAGLFSKLDDKHPSVILSIRRGKLLESMGRLSDARTLLKNAKSKAVELGFKKGEKKINEMLKHIETKR